MSVPMDRLVRRAINGYITSIGVVAPSGNFNERVIDLSNLGDPEVSGERLVQIVSGEHPPEMLQDASWVETFFIKTPQSIKTPSNQGVSHKIYQYALWIKTDKSLGVTENEYISDLFEMYFPNNLHIPIGDSVITVLSTYQQAVIVADNETGRLFNMVLIDCEVYYKNNN